MPDHAASLLRLLTGSRSRRAALHVAGSLSSLGLLGLTDADARRKKRKRKKKKCPTPPEPLTCAETCPDACQTCFQRPGAPIICGDNRLTACDTPCSSDSDCVESDRPYCLDKFENRATGEVQDVCAGNPGSFCSQVTRC
jgi:hypothetical protein